MDNQNTSIDIIGTFERNLAFFRKFREDSGVELEVYDKIIADSSIALESLKKSKRIIKEEISQIEKWAGEAYYTPYTDTEKCPDGDEVYQALEVIKNLSF